MMLYWEATHSGHTARCKGALDSSLVHNFVALVFVWISRATNVLFGQCQAAIGTVAGSLDCVPNM